MPRCIRVRIGSEIFRFAAGAIDIGSSPSNHLILPHDSVAPRHAALAVDATGSHVIVATNLRAVLVNGEQTLARNVYDGDLVHVGAYRLHVLERDPPSAPEQAFLDALTNDPGDDATRTVYADWLEEQGKSADAKASSSWRRMMGDPAIDRCPRRCEHRWNGLAPTDDANVRRCGECFDYVYYARTVDEGRLHASQRRRLAVDLTQEREPGDLDREPAGFLRRRESPPYALVLRPPDPIDLPPPIART